MGEFYWGVHFTVRKAFKRRPSGTPGFYLCHFPSAEALG